MKGFQNIRFSLKTNRAISDMPWTVCLERQLQSSQLWSSAWYGTPPIQLNINPTKIPDSFSPLYHTLLKRSFAFVLPQVMRSVRLFSQSELKPTTCPGYRSKDQSVPDTNITPCTCSLTFRWLSLILNLIIVEYACFA